MIWRMIRWLFHGCVLTLQRSLVSFLSASLRWWDEKWIVFCAHNTLKGILKQQRTLKALFCLQHLFSLNFINILERNKGECQISFGPVSLVLSRYSNWLDVYDWYSTSTCRRTLIFFEDGFTYRYLSTWLLASLSNAVLCGVVV